LLEKIRNGTAHKACRGVPGRKGKCMKLQKCRMETWESTGGRGKALIPRDNMESELMCVLLPMLGSTVGETVITMGKWKSARMWVYMHGQKTSKQSAWKPLETKFRLGYFKTGRHQEMWQMCGRERVRVKAIGRLTRVEMLARLRSGTIGGSIHGKVMLD
jgi:hypothetical protein